MIRLMNTVCDNLSSDDHRVIITSGSFGEGLEMRGSDIDVMFVTKSIKVHDKITPITFDSKNTHFSLMTDNSKPGFAMLRLISSPYPRMRNICEQFRGDKYLSNVLFKQNFLNEISPVVHGPCLSDINGHMDFANCLHSKYWVTSASRWTIRSNNAWPNEITKQTIISHGKNVGACQNSLRDLQLTITEDYFIGEDESLKSSSYYCLGTALQLMGDNVSARQAFAETVKLLKSISEIENKKLKGKRKAADARTKLIMKIITLDLWKECVAFKE
ncbi:unnamed protein product [Mytilus coruscus]|uniref:Mab-21-like nucleotidyltransferase domain-containing protein n=1 Tax=Mytilus coruscus TaxID=42192 RepID=A0A6J8ABH4_MYTCO|nr:unnamed protein product [Mytilus coruscus]